MKKYGPPDPRVISYDEEALDYRRVTEPDEDFDDEDLLDLENDRERAARKASESRAIEHLREEIADLDERIADRRRYGATAESLADDEGRLRVLRSALEDAEWQAANEDDRQARLLGEFSEEPDRAPSGPRQAYADILRTELSADEWRHWQAYQAGVKQPEIARMFGVTQGAISKREARLKAKVAAIQLRHHGRAPSSAIASTRRPGVRGKARNKPPSD